MGLDKRFQVGLFVILATAILAFGVIKLGDVTFARTYDIYIYFDNSSGLSEKSPVRIAGVEVGRIRSISLEGSKARVTASIRKPTVLYKSAQARVGSTGIIGTKYLELTQGDPKTSLLSPSDSIEGSSAPSMEESISRAFTTIRELVESIRGPKGQDFGRNLNETLANLNSMTLSLKEIFAERKNDISATLLALRLATQNLAQTMEKIDHLMTKVDKGEGAVGALFNDPVAGQAVKNAALNIQEASAGAAEVFGRFNRIHAFWDYRFRYDTEAAQGRSDFGIKLAMRPSRYYFAGIANAADSAAPLKTKDFEKKNTFNVGMGKEFSPWFDAYAGLLRSEGGVGIKVRPFHNIPIVSKTEIQAEALGFGRNTTFNNRNLTGTVVNVGVAYSVFPWLTLETRAEDLKETHHAYGGFRINLEDKDLAYLLGLVALTR